MRRDAILNILDHAESPLTPTEVARALHRLPKYRDVKVKKIFIWVQNDLDLDSRLTRHPKRKLGPITTGDLFEKEGKENLQGLSRRKLAEKIDRSYQNLTSYLRRHPSEVKRYQIPTESQQPRIPKPEYFTEVFVREFLRARFAGLERAEIEVLKKRVLAEEKPKTLEKIAREMKFTSHERIRQLEASALKKAEEYRQYRFEQSINFRDLKHEPVQELGYFHLNFFRIQIHQCFNRCLLNVFFRIFKITLPFN